MNNPRCPGVEGSPIDPQSTDCYLKFRFWGKNLSNGGGVWPSLTLGAIAGGISNSAILIDMIEITKLGL